MPSLIAWLINTMRFRPETRQIPIAQLGCAAGGAAVNRAHDFCRAYPDVKVLADPVVRAGVGGDAAAVASSADELGGLRLAVVVGERGGCL